MTDAEAASAVGVAERTWAYWKARARELASLLPADLSKENVARLREIAADVGLEVRAIAGTGKAGRVLKGDLVSAIYDHTSQFLQFLQALQAAENVARLSLLGRLDNISRGGGKVRKTKTVHEEKRILDPLCPLHTYRGDPKTRPTTCTCSKVVEIIEEKELPPDRIATTRLLEMRWPDLYGKATSAGGDPLEQARRVTEAARSMLATVPEPELETEDPVDMRPDEGGKVEDDARDKT